MLAKILVSVHLVFTVNALAKKKITTKGSIMHLQFPEGETSGKPLLYYGGPVIANVKVFVGLWNDRVAADTKNGIQDFYAAYVNSTNMDWLGEYKTDVPAVDGRAGTNQVIGRGQVLGQKLMTPSITAKKITDEQIQQEIESQIDAGNFPRPDQDTLYMIHFSRDISITIEGMSSCMAFGGYHSGFTSTKYGNIFYGVLPDCGGGFNNTTFVSSHELIEAVTDAFPTPGDKPAYPQAWNAADGNEIADLCPSMANFQGPKATYKISLEWSNTRNRCYDGK
jgi:hypothetical protein